MAVDNMFMCCVVCWTNANDKMATYEKKGLAYMYVRNNVGSKLEMSSATPDQSRPLLIN